MFPLMQSDGGRGRGAVRRIMAALGGLLALALVVSTLGLIRPSVGYAAPVEGSEPYTIGLDYSFPDKDICYVYDSNGGFCSKRDDAWAVNRYRDVARLLINSADYPEHDGPLQVVLRAPKEDVAEIMVPGSVGGNSPGSANPTVTQGFQTVNGVEYTTSTISWDKFDAARTSDLLMPFWFRVQDNLSNGKRFSLSAEATPGTAAQAAAPPSLSFTVHYQQLADVMVRSAGAVQQGGRPTVIGAPRHDANGYFPLDVSSLTRTSLGLRVPTLAGRKGVRAVESATVTWKLPSYGLQGSTRSRRPLVQLPENSEWTISADGSTATRTFTVPAGTDESRCNNALLKREIEETELSLYFPGMRDSTELTGNNAFSATISYTPSHQAEGEQPIVASASTGLRITSAANNGIGEVTKYTNWEGGWHSSRSRNDTEEMRKNDLPWRFGYLNTSGLPIHHLVLTDQLPQDDTTLRLVGFQGLTIFGFDSSKPGCRSVDPNDVSQNQCRGDITHMNLIQEVRAYTDATHYDSYVGS